MNSALARIFAAALLLALAGGCASGPRSRPIAWDALPFPKNSDWPGPQGVRAALESGNLVLQGQDVRTSQTYSKPVTIQFEVLLESRAVADGNFVVRFLPAGQLRDAESDQYIDFGFNYQRPNASEGRDEIFVQRCNHAVRPEMVWGPELFDLKIGKPHKVTVELSVDKVTFRIDDRLYEPSGMVVPYEKFCIQLHGWTPPNRWHVSNFSVR